MPTYSGRFGNFHRPTVQKEKLKPEGDSSGVTELRPAAPAPSLSFGACPSTAHRSGVIMRTLVALPAAAVDAREAGEAQLRLIVLQGLVSHHARARGPGALPSGAHGGPQLVLWEETQVCEAGQGRGPQGPTGTRPQGAGSSIKAKPLRCPARRWSGVPVAQVSSSVVTMPREVSTPIYHHMRTVG